MNLSAAEWYPETLYSDWVQSLRVDQLIERQKSDVQDLVIFENERFGRVLALDGLIQTTQADEFVYHEMMRHVPFF